MKSYFFSLESVMEMLKESYRLGSACETGGILIRSDNHDNVITHAISSGETAERGQMTYFQGSDDVDFLNMQLRKFQEKGSDLAGYFHRHPKGMKRLSYGDLNTCMEILTSSNYKVDNRLVMVIITESHDRRDFPIFAYEVSLNAFGSIEVEDILCNVYPLNCLKTALLKEGRKDESDNFKGSCRKIDFSA